MSSDELTVLVHNSIEHILQENNAVYIESLNNLVTSIICSSSSTSKDLHENIFNHSMLLTEITSLVVIKTLNELGVLNISSSND